MEKKKKTGKLEQEMYLAAFEIMFLPLLLKFTTRSLASCGWLVLAAGGKHVIVAPLWEVRQGT